MLKSIDKNWQNSMISSHMPLSVESMPMETEPSTLKTSTIS
jgi:hypothetical protein